MVQTKKQKRPSKNKKRTRSKKSHKGGSSNADFMKAINKADLEYIQSNIKQMEDLSFADASRKTPLDNAVEKYNNIPYPISNADDFTRFDNYTQIIDGSTGAISGTSATFSSSVDISSAGSAHFSITNTNVSGASQTYYQYVGSNGDLDAYFSPSNSFSSSYSCLDNSVEKAENSLFSYLEGADNSPIRPSSSLNQGIKSQTNDAFEKLAAERKNDFAGIQRI